MVARTWRGWTRREDAEAYVAYLEQTGMPAYRATPGNRGAWILRHDDGELTEFVTLTFWDSFEAIRGFAGDDIEVAVFYPEDDRFFGEARGDGHALADRLSSRLGKRSRAHPEPHLVLTQHKVKFAAPQPSLC